MNRQELLNYIGLFREKAEQGKLVVFVGAGVSCNVAGMPDWNTLIQNMANAIGYSKCTSCKHKCENCESSCLLKGDFSADEFLKIPQYVFNKDSALYDQILAESIPTIEADAPLSSAIFDINPAHIITTNYDHLLETSKNAFCEQYQVIVHDKDLLNAEKSKYIIKMHGDMSALDTIVLKEQDYLDYSQTHVLIELFVKSLLTDHIVLFLGYSLNDYNIKLLLSWLNYMRSQNGALGKGKKVGYIVLDQNEIDDTQLSYFNSNNVGVVNINCIPIIREIPESLTHEKGKRLYSFLSVISNPALEENIASIESSVEFMARYTFVSYRKILKLLYVKNYVVTDWHLRLFSKHDYTKLISYMESGREGSAKLKQLFLNAGIVSIENHDENGIERYIIGKFSENALVQDRLFQLYILNEYNKIELLLRAEDEALDSNTKCFYWSIIAGVNEVLNEHNKIEILSLTMEQKIAHLHNTAIITAVKTFPPRFDSKRVKQFIQNIHTAKERELFSDYLDIYEGNSKKCFEMQTALEKLKSDVCDNRTIHFGGTSCDKIYDIKRLAMAQYFFHYYNHVLYCGFSDLSNFFRPYIEAIMCSNCDSAERISHFVGIEFTNEKYAIEYIDVDIITKFISTKDLAALIQTYKVRRINAARVKPAFLIECFKNLCIAITTSKLYGFRQSSLSTLSNLVLLLNLVDLGEDDKKALEMSIENLLRDKDTAQILFSTRWPDFRIALREFSKLCQSLKFTCGYDVVYNIISNKDFFDYAVNVDFNSLRQLITLMLPKSNTMDISEDIISSINSTENDYQKILLLRLFFQYIKDEEMQKVYKDFLSENFSTLPTAAIYDFVFSGWLTLTSEATESFLSAILEINENLPDGLQSFPDPVETKLECVYLLHINGLITDIGVLAELAEGRPHLQFLLNPDNFDYTQVDFSNYMWENFARHEKYMEYFIIHKDKIIPNIKERMKHGDVSEAERKILYGFLLNGNEVWKV